MRFIRGFVFCLAMVSVHIAFGATTQSGKYTHCDITGPNLKSISLIDEDSCSKNCVSENDCRGWSFISGWNRCFLKSSVKSRSAVRMYAGRVERNGPSAKVIKQGWDFDDSGVDYRKISPLDKAEDCKKACLEDLPCQAFAYVQGYRVCWLKKSVGKWTAKVFSCGIRHD